MKQVIHLFLAAFIALVLAACSDDRPVLRLYNWGDYLAQDVIEAFENEYNCKIELDTFDSNEAMYAKLTAGASGYDIVVPSSYMAKPMYDQGMLEKLDHSKLPNVKNYNIAVKKRGDQMIFLRKIVPGATDDSYGIEVAKLAGIPNAVITRAREILSELESENGVVHVAPAPVEMDEQISMLDLRSQQVCDALAAITVETLTPIEAMNELYKLKRMLN